jgi:F-type H+-transporting ATPase subunit gamma
MANLRDIRRRIKSVQSTAKITKAMQMIASVKMGKAQEQALAGRAYAEKLQQVLASVKDGVAQDLPALLRETKGTRELVLVISTDRGLCGGLNANLLRKIRKEIPKDAHFVTAGGKLRSSLKRTGATMLADFHVGDPVPFSDARPIARLLADKFLEGEYRSVKVAFNVFVSTMTQEPWISQLLPVQDQHVHGEREFHKDSKLASAMQGESADPALSMRDYIFEPSARAVLETLLPLYLNFQIFHMLLEARASEHSARMISMKAATDNAKQVVDDLSLEANKLRQAAITSELLEITTATKAME